MTEGDAEAAGIIQGTIEEFAQEFATVIRRFLKLKEWKDTQRIVIGGGLRQSRIGELAIGRTAVVLKAAGHADRSAAHPAPVGSCRPHRLRAPRSSRWILSGYDSILAVDIGGSNIRAGVIELRSKKKPDLSEADVTHFELWRHREDAPKREDAVERLISMLTDLIKRAQKEGHKLAPFIGIGCPGVIRQDGSIERGGQNLPGNWEAKNFNLPQLLREAILKIGRARNASWSCITTQSCRELSELPRMQDVERWGVLTIGTGLGNAHYTNRAQE